MRLLIYGIDGVEADPERALLLIDEYLNDNDGEPDPVFYRLRGNAHGQLGMKEQAASDYAYAAENGDGDAYFHLAILTCLDENFNVKDFTRYSELMSKGQEAGSAAAYLENVIRGYRSGFLTHHAAVIEEYYLPRYVQQYGDEDYDAPEIEED